MIFLEYVGSRASLSAEAKIAGLQAWLATLFCFRCRKISESNGPELKKLCYICIRNNLKVKANLYATNKLATIAAMQ